MEENEIGFGVKASWNGDAFHEGVVNTEEDLIRLINAFAEASLVEDERLEGLAASTGHSVKVVRQALKDMAREERQKAQETKKIQTEEARQVKAIEKQKASEAKQQAKEIAQAEKEKADSTRKAERDRARALRESSNAEKKAHREAAKATRDHANAVMSLRDSLLGLLGLGGGFLGLGGIIRAGTDMALENVNVHNLAERTGVSAREIFATQEAGALSGKGVSRAEVNTAIQNWSNAHVNEALGGQYAANDPLVNSNRLGLDAATIIHQKSYADAVIEAVKELKAQNLNSAEISKRLEEVGLTSGNLTNWGMQSEGEIRKQIAQGYSRTADREKELKADERFLIQINNLKSAFQKVERRLLNDLMPDIEKAIKLLNSAISWAEQHPDSTKIFAKIIEISILLGLLIGPLKGLFNILRLFKSLGTFALKKTVGETAATVAEEAGEASGRIGLKEAASKFKAISSKTNPAEKIANSVPAIENEASSLGARAVETAAIEGTEETLGAEIAGASAEAAGLSVGTTASLAAIPVSSLAIQAEYLSTHKEDADLAGKGEGIADPTGAAQTSSAFSELFAYVRNALTTTPEEEHKKLSFENKYQKNANVSAPPSSSHEQTKQTNDPSIKTKIDTDQVSSTILSVFNDFTKNLKKALYGAIPTETELRSIGLAIIEHFKFEIEKVDLSVNKSGNENIQPNQNILTIQNLTVQANDPEELAQRLNENSNLSTNSLIGLANGRQF